MLNLAGQCHSQDIVGDGSVLKMGLAEGEGWEKPKGEDEARVLILARADDGGDMLYESPEGADLFTVKDGFYAKAIATAVTGMKKGEKAHLVGKPECE